MKKKLAILLLCFFMASILAGTALGKNDKIDQGNGKRVGQLKFSDTDADWAKDEIDKVAAKGYMKGYEDGKFQPNKPITCLEAIVALMNTLDQKGDIDLEDVDVDQYESLLSKIPNWGKAQVAAALDEGILLESEMKTFNPNQGIKRYEVAIYFYRMTEEGYGDYLNDFVGDIEEQDFDLDGILDDIDEAIESTDDIIDDYDDEADELDLDDFSALLEDLQDILNNLDEDDPDQEDIDEALDAVDNLIDELEAIIDDADEEEFDEDLVEALDEVMGLLEGIQSDLNDYRNGNTNRFGYFFNYFDESQIPMPAKQSVKYMQKLRIMNGDADGNFSPMRVVKRNELAAMLNRLDDNYFNQEDTRIISGILEDADYDNDEEVLTLTIVDEDGDEIDTVEVEEDADIRFDGADIDIDDEIETDGKIRVCINDQDEVLWVRIYSPEEVDEEEEVTEITGTLKSFTLKNGVYKFYIEDEDGEVTVVKADEDTIEYDGDEIDEDTNIESGGTITVTYDEDEEVTLVEIEPPAED